MVVKMVVSETVVVGAREKCPTISTLVFELVLQICGR